MSLKHITPASELPVTLADAKLAHRFDAADLDDDITAMIQDATRLVEHESGLCLMPQTWELTLDHFPRIFKLTRPPVTSVSSVKYVDFNGILQTIDPSAYSLITSDAYGPAILAPVYNTYWPIARHQEDAIKVRYICGYPDAASVPSHLKRQVKIFVAMMLEDPVQLSDRLAAIDKVWSA